MRRRLNKDRSASRPKLFGWLGRTLLISLLTLAVLEALLTAAGLPTWYPAHRPAGEVSISPWWRCDAPGCHYVYDAVQAACESGELGGRPCLVNRQGFPDTDDFDAADSAEGQQRLLILGDSFAFGMQADIGKSFVETLEAQLPDSLIWNAAIPGAGTQQALATFGVYGPILQPTLTLLAFFANDFDDNLMPVDSWLNAVGADGKAINVRKYRVDEGENVVKLDMRSLQLLTVYGKDPPHHELDYRLGLTRLGTLALKLIDRLGASAPPPERFDRRRETTKRYLRDLRDLVAESDSAFLVMLIPAPADISSPGLRYTIAAQLLEELGIPYLELRAMLDQAADYASPPDFHWSNSGHQKVGAILSDCLRSFMPGEGLAACRQLVNSADGV